MALSGATALEAASCSWLRCSAAVQCARLNPAPARFGKKPWSRNAYRFPLLKKKKEKTSKQNPGIGFTRYGCGFGVRAQAEVGSADGLTESEADGSGIGVWNGDQDRERAQALGESTIYPVMRVYRDDLCSLEVTGDAKAWKAIEAMAADGGFTAAEELSKGRSLMTVETIIPGRWNHHSTVSTKLLAPTQAVNKKAKSMWANKRVKMSSGNALARSFETVVMQNLLSFDIHVHSPGTVRDMANLANEKEDALIASLESRDANVLEGLAEAVCSYSLANIQDSFIGNSSRKGMYRKSLSFWRKPEWIWTLNKAVGVCPLSENEIWEHAKNISNQPTSIRVVRRSHQAWWPPWTSSLPSSILPKEGPNSWTTEFIPVHKIQIDTRKVKVIAKGWHTTKTEHVLELHITHAQLVDLADVLDLYFEDAYTTPAKTLCSRVVLTKSHLSQNKVTKTLWTAMMLIFAGGILLVSFFVMARLKASLSASFLSDTSSPSSSLRFESSFKNKWCGVRQDRQPVLPKNDDIPAEEMEALCVQVVNVVKDAFHLNGQVQSSPKRGAWIGSDFTELGRRQNSAEEMAEQSSGNGQLEVRDEEIAHQLVVAEDLDTSLSDNVAGKPFVIYQVVVSRTGRVLGFQPGNLLAVGHWVEYPFAQALHKDHRLGSGLFEHGLKFRELTEDVVAIELLCEGGSEAPSITARPLKL